MGHMLLQTNRTMRYMSNQSYFGNDLKIGRYFERGIHPAVGVQDPTIHAATTLGDRSCQSLIKVERNVFANHPCSHHVAVDRFSKELLCAGEQTAREQDRCGRL